jgi:vitamin B12 transporter
LRKAQNLIALFGADSESYQNVFGVRALGIDAAAVWTSPGDLVSLAGNLTYQDVRNDSAEGAFGTFNGQRIPNRPYLFGGGSARITLRDLLQARDQLIFTAGSRYVNSFFRGWEDVGLRDRKQVIPSQLVHSAAVSYLWRTSRGTVTTTLEASNLGDEAVYDYYGLQRPGRAFFLKTVLDF